ncbi:MAG: efflux RND transporter periplasmic adaptor subunit, partial [Ignavibacteriaceae bacterium]
SMQAVVDVDENDVVLVSIGDTATIKVDAFGDREFRGMVTEIGNSALSSGVGTQEQVVNFEVKINFFDLDDNLRPGMSCNADIQTETVENVISVPIQSVTTRENVKMSGKDMKDSTKNENKDNNEMTMDNKGPTEVVFIVKNGTAKVVPVKTGISDDNYLQIKEGLEGGESVVSGSYRAISRELEDGSKVRVDNKRKSFGNEQIVNN